MTMKGEREREGEWEQECRKKKEKACMSILHSFIRISIIRLRTYQRLDLNKYLKIHATTDHS